jgi:hypothetical protein
MDQVSMGKTYAHFFNKEVAEKVFKSIKAYPSQFQDCELKLLQKKEDEEYFKKIYLYLKDADYLNYVYESREDGFVKKDNKIEERKKENEVVQETKENKKESQAQCDEDGFIIVKSKKNK